MNIYIILGIVVVIYLAISLTNRKKSRRRRSRSFMGDYKRTDDKE